MFSDELSVFICQTGTKSSTERQIYNSRHSRARQVIENTFGVLVAQWRILSRPLEFLPDKAVNIVKACIALHNFMANSDVNTAKCRYIPANFVDSDSTGSTQPGQWRKVVAGNTKLLEHLDPHDLSRGGCTRTAISIRNDLMNFFQSPQGTM